jgi:hypothetical protein
MSRAIGTILGALALLAMLAGLAVAAEKKPPGEPGSTSRQEWCANESVTCDIQCVTDFDDLPGIFEPTCNDACEAEYQACLKARVGATIRIPMFDILQSPGILGADDISPYHTQPVGGLGAAEVEQACKRVNGLFGRTKNGFGCVNAKCDPAGECTLVCYGGNCLAITPGQLPDRVTLIGILQNGDNVSRGGQDPGGSLSPGGSTPNPGGQGSDGGKGGTGGGLNQGDTNGGNTGGVDGGGGGGAGSIL